MIVSRRTVLTAAATLLPAAAPPGRTASPQAGDVLVAIDDPVRALLRPDAIQPGAAPVLAWPMDRATGVLRDGARYNQILLLRVATPDPEGTLIAFSAICTHAGCLVSEWLAPTARLHCPCHGSEFDPAMGGAVVFGPAPTPLPLLPIQAGNGVVEVTGPFSAPPGGHTSRTM